VLEDLRRHKNLVETQASLYQFEAVRRIRSRAEEKFCYLRKAEDLSGIEPCKIGLQQQTWKQAKNPKQLFAPNIWEYVDGFFIT
jgi:hypothetical protein